MKKICYLSLIFIVLISCSQKETKITVRSILKNYREKICTNQYITKVYYVEFAKKYNDYIMFNEGVGYLVSSGYDCEIPLDNFSIIFENFRKSNRKGEWLEFLNNLYKDSPVTYQSDISPGYNSLLNSFRRFELSLLLNKKNIFALYVFNKEDNNSECLKFQSLNNDFKGKILVDEKNFIKEIYLDTCVYYCDALRSFTLAEMYIRYCNYNDKYFFDSISLHYYNDSLEQNIKIKTLEKKYIENIKLNQDDYRVLNIQDRNPYIIYDKRKWENYNLPYEINSIVLKKLYKDELNIEDQFKLNANKNYYISKDETGIKENINEINLLSEKILKRIEQYYQNATNY